MPAIESNVEAAWVAKQTAGRGTPATLAIKRFRKVGGDMSVTAAHANQAYSDGNRFQGATDFMNTLVGNGNPQLQGQPGGLSYLAYLMLGQETVTGAADPYQHVATPNNAGSFWSTWWKKVGATVGPLRQQFNDCKLVSLRVEASSASKVVHVTPTFVSLDAGVLFSSDPVQGEDADLPFLYTEGTGRFTIDGSVYQGHSAVAFTITDSVTPWYGDDVTPYDVVYGQGQVTIEGLTILVDQAGYQFFNNKIYGSPNPPAGTRPLRTVPALGSYALDLQRGTLTTFTETGAPTGGTFTITAGGVTTAGIAWNATAAAIQTALVNAGIPVTAVSGGPLNTTPVVVTFAQAGLTPTVTSTGLTGGASPAVTPSNISPLRQFKAEFPGVHWDPGLAIAGNPAGGAVELALGAQTRPVTGQPHIRITTKVSDPAYT